MASSPLRTHDPSCRRLQLVSEAETSVRGVGALVGLARAVAAVHLRGLPPHDPHQIGLAAAFGESAVRRAVTELVRVQSLDADCQAAATQHERDAV